MAGKVASVLMMATAVLNYMAYRVHKRTARNTIETLQKIVDRYEG